MGYTDIEESLYKPPQWMQLYNNLTHCKFCNAVYTKDTKFVKVATKLLYLPFDIFEIVRKMFVQCVKNNLIITKLLCSESLSVFGCDGNGFRD